ncbi:MAG: nitroreductase family protein, partial [Clostridia bacterium]|nr:nitroreductase family protein [Clostridia bacterium]
MLARRSIRKFQDKPVCTEDIDKMLRGAMSAPSACNKQPWEFYVVTNAELLGKLQTSSLFSRYKSPC